MAISFDVIDLLTDTGMFFLLIISDIGTKNEKFVRCVFFAVSLASFGLQK